MARRALPLSIAQARGRSLNKLNISHDHAAADGLPKPAPLAAMLAVEFAKRVGAAGSGPARLPDLVKRCLGLNNIFSMQLDHHPLEHTLHNYQIIGPQEVGRMRVVKRHNQRDPIARDDP